eukprot:3505334-Rhodomonas_salina.1
MSGTGLAYVARKAVLRWRMLPVCYAMRGTEIAYAATRRRRDDFTTRRCAISLRACYAMSGTDISYGGARLCACYAMSGTDLLCDTMSGHVLVPAGGPYGPSTATLRVLVTMARDGTGLPPFLAAKVQFRTETVRFRMVYLHCSRAAVPFQAAKYPLGQQSSATQSDDESQLQTPGSGISGFMELGFKSFRVLGPSATVILEKNGWSSKEKW